MSDRFNDGLEQGIELGELRERERIIKLLEENFARFDASNNQVDYMSLTEFVELIKGETK